MLSMALPSGEGLLFTRSLGRVFYSSPELVFPTEKSGLASNRPFVRRAPSLGVLLAMSLISRSQALRGDRMSTGTGGCRRSARMESNAAAGPMIPVASGHRWNLLFRDRSFVGSPPPSLSLYPLGVKAWGNSPKSRFDPSFNLCHCL